jgi:hypothetical protein
MLGQKRRHFLDLDEEPIIIQTNKRPRDESLEIGDYAEK